MPEVDVYGTAGPHTIIRQHIDYGHWYCRNKLTLKEYLTLVYTNVVGGGGGGISEVFLYKVRPSLDLGWAVQKF